MGAFAETAGPAPRREARPLPLKMMVVVMVEEVGPNRKVTGQQERGRQASLLLKQTKCQVENFGASFHFGKIICRTEPRISTV